MGKLATVKDVTGATSIAEVLALSATGYTPNMVPAKVSGPDGRLYDSSGFNAIVRDDTGEVIGTVGERYRINDHKAHLSALDTFVQAGTILPVNVSMWDNGAVLAYQFRCPDLDVVVHGKDMVSPLLTLAFAYGFPLSDSAFFSDFRWFCKNHMGRVAALTEGYRVRHKGDVTNRFADVLGHRISELGGELSGRYQAMRQMVDRPMKGRALVEYVGEVIQATPADVDVAWTTFPEDCQGDAKRIHDVIGCYAVDDCGAEGTVWQAYNAVTRYQTHKAGRNEATRQRSMLLGAGSAMANRAWELAARVAV